jgi:hypothetical protein
MGQKISLKVWDRNGPVIRTRELGKTYPNGTRALKNVDFSSAHQAQANRLFFVV